MLSLSIAATLVGGLSGSGGLVQTRPALYNT